MGTEPESGQGRESVEVHEVAMTRLVREHHGAAFGFVRLCVPDPHRAEDLVRETMLRVWHTIGVLRTTEESTRCFLFAVARIVVIDAWRAEQRQPRLVSDCPAMASTPSADDSDRGVGTEVVEAALERLSVEHREILRELYCRGRTVRETAKRLNVPEGIVKSRAFYALRAVRLGLVGRAALS